MNRSSSFGKALRVTRRARNFPQEEFAAISGRTYISALERGLKQPTLTKVDALARLMRVHPLTLLALSYVSRHSLVEVKRALDQVLREVEELGL
jgi:transcriptional regulator with XRE-family HTH domain